MRTCEAIPKKSIINQSDYFLQFSKQNSNPPEYFNFEIKIIKIFQKGLIVFLSELFLSRPRRNVKGSSHIARSGERPDGRIESDTKSQSRTEIQFTVIIDSKDDRQHGDCSYSISHYCSDDKKQKYEDEYLFRSCSSLQGLKQLFAECKKAGLFLKLIISRNSLVDIGTLNHRRLGLNG